MSNPCDEWTLSDHDSWHIRVYMPGDGYFDDLGHYTLAEMQEMYDAVIFRAGVAIGASYVGFGDSADVYVDLLEVNTSRSLLFYSPFFVEYAFLEMFEA